MRLMLSRHLRLLYARSTTYSSPRFDHSRICFLTGARYLAVNAQNIPQSSVKTSPGEDGLDKPTVQCDLEAAQHLDGKPEIALSNYLHLGEAGLDSTKTDTDILASETTPANFITASISWQLNPARLEVESDVGHARDIGSKLVDDAQFSNDFSLWKELLLYRQRHYGNAGTIDIWRGLSDRCKGVELPTEGGNADFLWESFIAVGLKESWLLEELQMHAEAIWKKTGKRWSRLYESVIGYFIKRGDKYEALKWHLTLKDTHTGHPNDILCVFEVAMSSKEGLAIFQELCEAADGHRIYSFVVPRLWRGNMIKDALVMHDFLLRRGDIPQAIEEVEPLIKYVESYDTEQQRTYFMGQLFKFGVLKTNSSANGLYSPSPTMNGTTLKAPDIQKPKVKDELAARLFATKAFSFDLILGSLKVFGVEAIGPLSLREMTLRTPNISELELQILALKDAGISIVSSVFAKVLDHLISRKDQIMLHDLIYNDQHPDVLEDLETQESLLKYYSLSRDWRRVNLTLTILSFLSREDPYTYNIQLRNAFILGDSDLRAEILDKMRRKCVSPSQTTIDWMIRNLLPQRRPTSRPLLDKYSRNSVLQLLGTFQYVIKYGGYIPPESWKAGLKFLVISRRLHELERLCIWLADAYYPKGIGAASSTSSMMAEKPTIEQLNTQLPPAHQQSPLRIIFNVELQRAIISCGFSRRPIPKFSGFPTLNPFSSTPEPVVPWVWGIILLRKLKEKGVYIQTGTVQRECRIRLATLFGDFRESKRKRNRMLRKTNQWPLEEIVMDIHKVWGTPIFKQFSTDLKKLANPRQRPSRPKKGPKYDRPKD